jgi:hypothetical protein
VKKVEYDKTFEELSKEFPLSSKVPLNEFLVILNDVWETEGII